MKTILSFFFAFLLAVSANAQLITNSSTEVSDGDKVVVDDAAPAEANTASATASAPQVVDAAVLNSVLKSINQKLEVLSHLEQRLSMIEQKVDVDPYFNPYNGHAYVDLGTGVKWATMNIGASSPDDYGDYFAWGETVGSKDGKKDFSVEKYKWCKGTRTSYTKYVISYRNGVVDNLTELTTEDDVARQKWGGGWRMPTFEEAEDIRNLCYWQWVTSYNGKDVKGYIVYKAKADADKGKRSTSYTPKAAYSLSDPHIFLPAGGYYSDTKFIEVGTDGLYMTSSLWINTERIHNLLFRADLVSDGLLLRFVGENVRAVCP